MNIPNIHWLEDGKAFEAQWRSHSGTPPATRVVVTDGKMTADEAYGLACQGTSLLWRGDFQEARQMLTALGKRADRNKRPRTSAANSPGGTSIANSADAFHQYRQARSQRARTLNALLIPLNDDYSIPLRRAPDIRQACVEAYGPAETASVTSLRGLQGVIGAHEWRTERHRACRGRRPNSSALRCLCADPPRVRGPHRYDASARREQLNKRCFRYRHGHRCARRGTCTAWYRTRGRDGSRATRAGVCA